MQSVSDKTYETQADTKNACKLTYDYNPLQDLKRLRTSKNNSISVTMTITQHAEWPFYFFLNFLQLLHSF